jgi:hypothetical protein
MIFGLDHIAINSVNIEACHQILLGLGYYRSFAETVENSIHKKPLLNEYHKSHLLSYYLSESGNMPIELTQHGNKNPNVINSPLKINKNQIIISTCDVKSEILFWSQLLNYAVDKNQNIKFKSILKNRSFNLSFSESSHKYEKYNLDIEGCTCIALLVNKLDYKIEKLKQKFDTIISGPWFSIVNNKKMKIAMLRTPGNVIVELIQIGD